MAKSKRAARKLRPRELAEQHVAELPNREAMSLLLPSTGGLPMMPTDPTGVPASGPTPMTGVESTALDQTSSAQQTALTSGASGVNAPNGTATSSSAT
jgi:hypothetical protein